MRIGILGGTFDPPHVGHLEFANRALEQLSLDEVLWLPAHRNPLKKRNDQTPSKQRLEMVRMVAKTNPKFATSDIEITRGGASYMIETLMELQMVHPGEYWLLLGADAVKTFDEWKNPQRLLRMCRLGIAIRPPTTKTEVLAHMSEEMKERTDFVEMKPLDISSTELRTRIGKSNGLITPFIDPEVLQYIKQNKLYRS